MPSDCAYIFSIRNNSQLNQFLGGNPATIIDQKFWLDRYFERYQLGVEYYFVICRSSDFEPCGLLRLYDVGSLECTWGSWVLNSDRPNGAAVESAYLSFRFAFDKLGLVQANLKVHKANQRAIQLYKLFGFQISEETEDELDMTLTADNFRRSLESWNQLLQPTANSEKD